MYILIVIKLFYFERIVINYTFLSTKMRKFDRCKKLIEISGHSRSIVGVEKRNGQISLIIFDPAQSSTSVQNELRQCKTTSVRRGQSTFVKNRYQIMYIEEGLMSSSEERERSKVRHLI